MRFQAQGAEVFAYTGGRPLTGGQPLLVFVHGAQHDHSVFGMQSRYLAHHGWSVLAVDLPGHGRSGGAPLPTIEAMAAWLVAAVAAACAAAGIAVPPTVLIGHSMGSLAALEATAADNGRAPLWLAGVALLGSAVPMPVANVLLDAARDDEARAFDMINLWSSAGINHRPGSPGPGFSTFVQNRRLMERQRPGVLLNDFNACNAYAAGLDRAAALSVPALYVSAERDQMTPAKAVRRAVEVTPVKRVVVVPGCGHNLMNERPDETLDALRGWLSEIVLPSVAPKLAA